MKSFLTTIKNKSQELKHETYALYLAYKNPATPWYAKVFTAVIIAYAFSPIDLIPDFIPVLGYLDDLVIVPLGIWLALKMIPDEVIQKAREQAGFDLAKENPKGWVAAAAIILIWITVLSFSIYGAIKIFKK